MQPSITTERVTARPAPAFASAERQLGLRGSTDFPVVAHDGTFATHCRAVDLSSTGVVLERGRPLVQADGSNLLRLELYLPGANRPIRTLARVVRSAGSRQAFKFIAISDPDRLSLAEHLDSCWRRGSDLH
jgi:hypothetical protein